MIDATIITGIISALGLVLVARVKLTGDRDANRAPDWQAYVKEQKDDIDGLKEDLKDVRGEVRKLRSRVDALERKYRAALTFIRHLLVRHPENRVDVPAEIGDDL